MADDVLERWFPESRFARPPLAVQALAPNAVMLLVLVAFFAVAARSLFPFAIAAFGVLVWLMRRGIRGSRHNLLTREACFELTADCVRVRLGDASRTVPLPEIAQVEVLRAHRRANVGHVVMHRHDSSATAPAIPTGRRVSGGTTGLVTWAQVEHADPAQQLFEGALTFWFVAQPEEVRARVEAAIQGVSPHSRGPHR